MGAGEPSSALCLERGRGSWLRDPLAGDVLECVQRGGDGRLPAAATPYPGQDVPGRGGITAQWNSNDPIAGRDTSQPWDERDTETSPHERGTGVPLRGLMCDRRSEASGGTCGQHESMVCSPRPVHDPRFVGGFAQQHRCSARELVIRRHQKVERIVEQFLLVEPGIGARWRGRGRDHHGQVGLLCQQQLEAFLRVGLDDPHSATRVCGTYPGGDVRQQRGRGGGEPAQS